MNEEKTIATTIQELRRLEPAAVEIIVVDANSTDGTQRLARRAGARVVAPPANIRGRAIQMNLGAKLAKGDILCFVHADTRVPQDMVTLITGALTEETACGGFVPLIASRHRTYWYFPLTPDMLRRI